MATVYEKESGKAVECEAVDAREMVDSGFYIIKEEDQPKPKAKGKAKSVDFEDPVK